MKKVLITALLLVSVLSLNAQSFGVKAGMNYNNWHSSEDISGEIDPMLLYQAGVFANFDLSEKISLQPELLYTAKGIKAAGNSDFKYRLDYLDIPIMAQYHINEAFFVNFGPELSFLTKAIISDGTESVDMIDGTESFNYALNLGISYQLPIGLIFDARYAYGLGSVYKMLPGDLKILNNAFQVTVGYVIPFKKQ